MPFLKNKIVWSVIFAAIIAALLAFLASSNSFLLWQNRLSDSLSTIKKPSTDIVIVTVDDKTIFSQNGLGLPADWQRDIYSQVIDNIADYDPAVIGIDVIFAQSKNKQKDALLTQSLKEIENDVIAYIENPIFDVDLNKFKSDEVSGQTIYPYNDFRKNSTLGYVVTKSDDDDVVRRSIPFLTDPNTGVQKNSFSLAVVNEYKTYEQNILLENGQFRIQYYSEPKGSQEQKYQEISFLDVYNDQYDPSINPEIYFKDKIVLIGAYSTYFQDSYFTPADDEYRMYGVEIHANAVQTLLEGDFLRDMTNAEQIALIVVLAFGSVFVFMYTRILVSAIYLVAVPTGYALVAQPLFNAGIIPDMVHPYLTVLAAFVITYVYRYIVEFREKLEIRGTFSKYVSPAVVNEIMKNPSKVKLGGEKRNVTVLFTDIAHFTTISEALSPESLVALLNEYLEAMTEEIMAEGGTVDKYEGDAIMAYFGAPLEQNDHYARACRVALAMRKRLDKLREQWKNAPPLPGGESRPEIDFRCGINSGVAIVGNVGSSKRLEYTVMGDNINLGSRLEGANKNYGTNLMISESTYEKVKDIFETRELDLIKVVGKTKPIRVFELLNEKGALVPAAQALLKLYNEGLQLYKEKRFEEALHKFEEILKAYPQDGPTKLYRQRSEILRNFPPPVDWDGVFEMRSK